MSIVNLIDILAGHSDNNSRLGEVLTRLDTAATALAGVSAVADSDKKIADAGESILEKLQSEGGKTSLIISRIENIASVLETALGASKVSEKVAEVAGVAEAAQGVVQKVEDDVEESKAAVSAVEPAPAATPATETPAAETPAVSE